MTAESDLRSLDRARMHTIFKPLDAEERLPREQVLAAKRFRSVGRWELAGAGWLPPLVVGMGLGQWANAPPPMALAAGGVTFLGVVGFALGGEHRLRLK